MRGPRNSATPMGVVRACAVLLTLGLIPPSPAADTATSDKQGFLYEVAAPSDASGAGRQAGRLVLFGTIHVDRNGASTLNTKGRAELEGAQRLALEANPRDVATIAQAVRQLAYYPAGDSLSRHLPGDQLAAVRRLATGRFFIAPENLE